MAAQTQYVVPTPADSNAVTTGTVSRQWMIPSGIMLNEVITAPPGGGQRPVVQTSG